MGRYVLEDSLADGIVPKVSFGFDLSEKDPDWTDA